MGKSQYVHKKILFDLKHIKNFMNFECYKKIDIKNIKVNTKTWNIHGIYYLELELIPWNVKLESKFFVLFFK